MRLATLGLGLALVLGSVAPGASAAPPASRSPTLYHKSRSFRIPFNVDPAERSRLREVQLWVSDDSGLSWKPRSITTPDRPSFTFRASRDAEYWFAVRTLDTKGRLFPGDDEQVEPSMKVIVDTSPPSVVLDPEGRRGSMASVRWEVSDEHLDLASFALEYQAEGADKWRRVPIRQPALIGSESWDAGTAEPLRVRATVSDRAGNSGEAEIRLDEGVPNNPGVATRDASEFSEPPPISQISSGPNFPPVDEFEGGPRAQSNPFPPPPTTPAPATPSNDAAFPDPDPVPFGRPERFAGPAPEMGGGGAPSPGGGGTMLVGSSRIALQYAVDDAGPGGPATVELWVTQDGGQHWSRHGVDPDRVSPFEADLGGEGTFGLRLVARASSGLGDPPPAPGEPPQMWVEVDSTAPNVQLLPIQVGTGAHAGKIAISWRASDLHLGPRPVVLSWRAADQAGARWIPITEAVENSSPYIWTVPLNVPARFHLRVDVVDTAGNRGFASTLETGPVTIDRARPRSRIIGLDPARTGARTAVRPFQ